MKGNVFDPLFKLFKPVEDFVFKQYDNDYLVYAVMIGFLLLLIGLGFFIFKISVSIFTKWGWIT